MQSPPTRGRELKYSLCNTHNVSHRRRPYAGAGIEIPYPTVVRETVAVAPYAGAGIEISGIRYHVQLPLSPPTRGRELKYFILHNIIPTPIVAPYAGAGIEMSFARSSPRIE